jgi:hypothetical protein
MTNSHFNNKIKFLTNLRENLSTLFISHKKIEKEGKIFWGEESVTNV